MNLEKYTQKAQSSISDAQSIARDLNHPSLEPEHLLLALLRQPEGVVPVIVTQVAGSPAMLQVELEKDLDAKPKMHGGSGQTGLSRSSAAVLTAAEKQAAAINAKD